jgi:hypothetical protein
MSPKTILPASEISFVAPKNMKTGLYNASTAPARIFLLEFKLPLVKQPKHPDSDKTTAWQHKLPDCENHRVTFIGGLASSRFYSHTKGHL